MPGEPDGLREPPAGRGPWSLVVVSTGSPRDGDQVATLATPSTVRPPFTLAATLPRYPVLTPGDRVVVEGSIRPRPDSEYGRYLERIGAVGTLSARSLLLEPGPTDPGRQLEDVRRGASEALAKVLPEPEAGLASGILIGLRDRVDRDLAAAFTTAGVSHVVAISGWNIAIVAAAVSTVAGRLGRRRRSLVTVLAIGVYVAFAGASASVVRAAAMAGVVLLARETGRAGRAAAALGWAATVLLVIDPGLIDDAGFQLSSLATAGLIAWATPLTAWLQRTTRGRVPGWLAESLGVSLAAQAATLPIVLLSFGRLAVLSPVVNLVVVPLVAPAMAAGLVALLGGIGVLIGLPPALGTVLAAPGWVILRLLVALVDAAASLPFASITAEPPIDTALSLATVAALGALTWWRGRCTGRPGTSPGTATDRARESRSSKARRADRSFLRRAAVMAFLAAFLVAGGVVAARPSAIARVTILDVGQGDAILVEGSRGGRLLIDGGPDPDRLLVALDRRVPPWDRRIDSVILSHPHEDHVAGLALLLERYHVRHVMEPGMRGPGPGYAAWLSELRGTDAPVRTGIAAGDRLAVDEIRLTVLWPIRGRVPPEPPDTGTGINNVSVVLAGQVGTRRFLLMGDVEQEIDPELIEGGLPPVDLLKVAHHGSRTATTQAFVDAVRPRVAVASAGAGNPYGHPARSTLDRLAAAGARVLRTDLDGTVVVGFDTRGLSVRTEGARPAPTARPAASPSAAVIRFRCAIPVTALVPELEPAGGSTEATARRAGTDEAPGRAAGVGYHRADDGAQAGGGRLPPALPGSRAVAPPTRARRRRGRELAGCPDGNARRGGGSWDRRSRGAAPRRGQGGSAGRSPPATRPWQWLGGLALPGRVSRAGAGGRRPSGHPSRGRRRVPRMAEGRVARGADRGLCGQACRPTARVDGRTLRVVASPLSVRPGQATWGRLERGDLRDHPGRGVAAGSGRLPRGRHCAWRGSAARVDRPGDPERARSPGARAMNAPHLAYFWGDDDLAAARAVARFGGEVGAETGAPPERLEVRGDRNRAGEQVARLAERVATPAMFGGGTMVVVSNPGALVQATEHRSAMLSALALVAPGNAMVVIDATPSGAKGPSQKRLADAVAALGGVIRKFESPRRGALAGWIEAEAASRGLRLAPGTAKALAERIGGLVDLNDVERRHQTRIAASELDKLSLLRGTEPITPDDVRALVTEAVPGSVWAFTDAVGERRGAAALELLDRLIDDTPEPVLVAVLHRRTRELLEIGDRIAGGERLAAAAKAMGIASDYRAQTLAAQARRWTNEELTAALDGLVELDAMVKGAPGSGQDEAQRRLAFSLWVTDYVART
jgi:competence protein ComEC